MNMKEATKFLENIIQPTPTIKPRQITIEKVNGIVGLLKRGERFEKMWRKIQRKGVL